jgi:hypothetical protein
MTFMYSNALMEPSRTCVVGTENRPQSQAVWSAPQEPQPMLWFGDTSALTSCLYIVVYSTIEATKLD